MSNLNRRVGNIEKELSLNEKHSTVTIIRFGGKLLPEQTSGNITTRCIMYGSEEYKAMARGQ